MKSKNSNWHQELRQYRLKYGITTHEPCSAEETARYAEMLNNEEPLPQNVHQYVSPDGLPLPKFYKIVKTNTAEESDLEEYLILKQLNYLRITKNCVLFLTILTIVGLGCGVVLGLFSACSAALL